MSRPPQPPPVFRPVPRHGLSPTGAMVRQMRTAKPRKTSPIASIANRHHEHGEIAVHVEADDVRIAGTIADDVRRARRICRDHVARARLTRRRDAVARGASDRSGRRPCSGTSPATSYNVREPRAACARRADRHGVRFDDCRLHVRPIAQRRQIRLEHPGADPGNEQADRAERHATRRTVRRRRGADRPRPELLERSAAAPPTCGSRR